MSETYTTYGIGLDKQADELQALRDEVARLRGALQDIHDSIGNGAGGRGVNGRIAMAARKAANTESAQRDKEVAEMDAVGTNAAGETRA